MNWDEYFFTIADAVAKKSHCLSRQLGAVAVRNNTVISTGYNGPPRGYPHCEGEICPRHKAGFKSGEGLDICPAAHAERNVLVQAARVGVRLEGSTLYLTSGYPCRECAKEMVNCGILEVVISKDQISSDLGLTGQQILQSCGVIVRVGR